MRILLTLPLLILSMAVVAQSCNRPMDNYTFANEFALLATRSVGFDRAARDFTYDNCLYSSQIAQVSALYRDNTAKYDYLMYAYPLAYDPQNYTVAIQTMPDPGLRQRLFDYVRNNPLNVPPPPPANPPTPNPWPNQPPVYEQPYVPGYTGRIGCQDTRPMNENAFQNALASITSKGFETTKLTVAKQIAQSNCLTTDQVRRIMGTFDHESTKLDFAKNAFFRTYDIDNYHIVTQAFGFESSTTNLMAFVGQNMPANAPYANAPVYAPADPYYPPANPAPQYDPYYYPQQNPTPPPPPAPVPGYNGRTGCGNPMSPSEFQSALNSIRAKSFESTKLSMAKSLITNRCVTVSQVRELMGEFGYESSRLDFAKYAFNSTYDLDNYYMVTDVFQFDSSTRELMDYIRGK